MHFQKNVRYDMISLYYILCHGWEVDAGFIQPEVKGQRDLRLRVAVSTNLAMSL